ncbi:hypothetical protein P9869_01400 [Streptomyces ossamyceticus]|nr:hypothetical protein [Streptomyces ossamyceticus]
MTAAEHLLVLAESLLQLVELAGGADGAEEMLRAQGPQARDAVAATLDSAHPDRAGLRVFRGRYDSPFVSWLRVGPGAVPPVNSLPAQQQQRRRERVLSQESGFQLLSTSRDRNQSTI